jgi:RNA polymerase sigma-70 factor (ECF subfamily)
MGDVVTSARTGEPVDADLLRATGAGDRTAFETLYGRHAPWLVVRLTRRCNDPALVDEAVQDTFVAVWRGARRWDGRGRWRPGSGGSGSVA